ncbi:MAG TPA: hypothetical protein VF883_00565 [Thermoanaerobaculia bacterium]
MSADYFLEIESHFVQRRGTPFPILGPKDWELMKKWSEDGVPLPVVLEAIDSVFDKREAKGKKVNSLTYCKHAVKEMWDERKELQVGAEGLSPEESPQARLDALATVLESTPAADYAPRVRELAKEQTLPRIEDALMELETLLIEELLLRAPHLREEATALAAGADEKSRARSMDAHLRRLVREEFAIPRLTIF